MGEILTSESHFSTDNTKGIETMNLEREIILILGGELPEDDFVLPDSLSDLVRGSITDDKRYALYRNEIATAIRDQLLSVEHRKFDEKTKVELLDYFGIRILVNKEGVQEGKIPASICELLGEESKDSYVSIEGTKVMIIPLENMNNYMVNSTSINVNQPLLSQLNIGQSGNRLLITRHGKSVTDFYGKLFDIKKNTA